MRSTPRGYDVYHTMLPMATTQATLLLLSLAQRVQHGTICNKENAGIKTEFNRAPIASDAGQATNSAQRDKSSRSLFLSRYCTIFPACFTTLDSGNLFLITDFTGMSQIIALSQLNSHRSTFKYVEARYFWKPVYWKHVRKRPWIALY